jgi:hypothetical protein
MKASLADDYQKAKPNKGKCCAISSAVTFLIATE